MTINCVLCGLPKPFYAKSVDGDVCRECYERDAMRTMRIQAARNEDGAYTSEIRRTGMKVLQGAEMTTYAIEVIKDGRALFRTGFADMTPHEINRRVEDFREKWPECRVEVIESRTFVTVHKNWPERT